MKTPAEREAETRAEFERMFERICPGILGNPFLPQTPFPKQAVGLAMASCASDTSEVFEMLYGGSAGPGKSSWLLMAAGQYAWRHGDFSALILRRTFAELSKPGAIMDRALEWWQPRGVHWDGQTKTFTFPSGAKVAFGYLQHEHDHLQYQGAEFHMTGWDELTQFQRESQYLYIARSRVRRASDCKIPLRSLATSNPGGPGHAWVKKRFIGDPEAGVKAPHPYLPGRLEDNPHIDADAYIAGLIHLHPTAREQLLNGDWRARDPGDYFRAEWFGPLLDPETDTWPSRDCIRIRWWDLAASEKEDAAFTAGVRMARHRSGVRAIEHCRAFRATPGKRDDLIVQTAKADGYGVTVGLEIEGGSGGPAQFEALSKRLRAMGFRVVGARPRVGAPDLSDREKATMIRQPTHETGKAGRADPVASCLERGYQRRGECIDTGGPWWGADANVPVEHQRDGIRLFAGPWTQSYLDVVEGFPDGATCDEVDATSGAWAWLEAHPFGATLPPTSAGDEGQGRRGDPSDMHPDDRDELEAGRPRRWGT